MGPSHRWVFASFAIACLIGGPASAAPDARGVQTETIIVPPGEGAEEGGEPAAMPEVPGDAGERATAPAGTAEQAELPIIEYDFASLPTPVRRLREQIIEAAKTGDPEKLRPIIDANGEPPVFSFSAEGSDPLATFLSNSGDAEGREILAILIEVLEAGFVHVDVGTPDEMYVWPYFARYPVERLTPPQLVELFRLVYAGDYEDMKAYGSYAYYRAGIAPDGTWRYFAPGD